MSIYATDGNDAIDMGLTIEEVLAELHALGYSYTTADCFGAAHDFQPNWRANAVAIGVTVQPEGHGDSATEAYRACLAAARALLTPANRAHPETW